MEVTYHVESFSLYAATGARKYLTATSASGCWPRCRRRPRAALFALTLAWTGARVSEVLALAPHPSRSSAAWWPCAP